MFPIATIQDAEKATWLIKFCNSKSPIREIERYKRKCLDDQSIGIHYDIVQPIHGTTIGSVRSELRDNYIGAGYNDHETERATLAEFNKKRYYTQVHKFKNEGRVGDTILIGFGGHMAEYVAEIASDCYFTNESCFTLTETSIPELSNTPRGYFTRRRLTNIRKLPEGTKWTTKVLDTVKNRPSDGWGLK